MVVEDYNKMEKEFCARGTVISITSKGHPFVLEISI